MRLLLVLASLCVALVLAGPYRVPLPHHRLSPRLVARVGSTRLSEASTGAFGVGSSALFATTAHTTAMAITVIALD
jgi:hypothetical protein